MEHERRAILLIDDDPDFAGNMVDIFEQHGLRMVAVGTGTEGLRLAPSGSFALVLLDLHLPDAGGIEVIRRIKEDSPEIEVIVETGYGSLETAMQALDLGAFSYIVKPVDPGQLLSLCQRALERAETRLALRQSEENYRIVFEKNSDAILVSDTEGRILDTNPAASRLFGYTRDELRALSPDDLMTPETMALRQARMEQVLRTGEAAFETSHRSADGTVVLLEARSNLIQYEGKQAILAVFRDITERKAAELELQRVNDELERFSAAVSHDLRSPLSVMGVGAATLENLLYLPETEQNRSRMYQVVKMLRGASRKADNLIEDLLALAEAGQRPRNVEKVEVAQIVDRILEERAPLIKKRGISVNRSPELGRILANASQIYQVFANLLDNAIRHNDNPIPRVDILLLEKAPPGTHSYLIRDNGSGIRPEDLDQVFTPFFKGEPGGTGIGLATVQRIIEAYGGSIRAYDDRGACFEFTIKDFEEPAGAGE